MGIGDHLRRIEAEQLQRAQVESRSASIDVARQREADRQLVRLCLEALPIVRQRKHPLFLEVVSIEIKYDRNGLAKKVKSTQIGQVFPLLQPFVKGLGNNQHVIADDGTFFLTVDVPELNVPNGFDFGWYDGHPARWRRRVVEDHKQQLAARAGRAGCATFGGLSEVRALASPVNPYDAPASSYSPGPSFFLSNSGSLLYGQDETYARPADEWFADQMAR